MAHKNIKFDILIVEDHALTRFGLKTVFEAQGFINKIYEAEDGETALALVKEYKPEVIILDLGLPDIDGIQLAKKIKEIDKQIKILILTSHNNQEEVWASLSAGANGYCLKDIEPERLVRVVEYVYEGAAWIDPGVADVMLKGITSLEKNTNSFHSQENAEKIILTGRETEVLKLIVEGHSNSQISKILCVSIHTAKAHVCNILQKLSVEDRTQAAIKAIKDGIV
jgi:DNA-binding NarL/FixJ family response regulator